jgi:uncharacterized membrane-anchored protein
MWPLAPSRVDILAWTTAIVLAAAGTSIASASGARLGVALTVGEIILIAVVVTFLIVDGTRHRGASIPGTGDD